MISTGNKTRQNFEALKQIQFLFVFFVVVLSSKYFQFTMFDSQNLTKR